MKIDGLDMFHAQLLRVRLVAQADQAPQMQARAVWMPVLGHGPVPARAASPPKARAQRAYACERAHARGRRKAGQPIN